MKMIGVSGPGLQKLFSKRGLNREVDFQPLHDPERGTIYVNYRLTKSRKWILCEIKEVSKSLVEEFSLSAEQQRLIEAGENLSRIIHGLKSPFLTVNAIAGDLLTHPELEPFYPDINGIREVARRGLGRINDSLRTDRQEEFEIKEVALFSLLAELKNDRNITSRLKGIELEIGGEEDVTIEGVEALLKEAVVLLIDNAIYAVSQAQRPDGKITVDVAEIKDAETPKVTISVSDNGIGIQPEILNSIFKYQYTTKPEGTGVGLAIIRKNIEENHGGRVTVTSQVGQGATFTLHLFRKLPDSAALLRPKSILEKIRKVRKMTGEVRGIDTLLVSECFDSMTFEHLRESTVNELHYQIKGQIERLIEFVDTGTPHLSINNFSRRTEIVVAADVDSARRPRWIELINHELVRMGIADQCAVAASRKIQRGKAVCRIFEIKKCSDDKLTGAEMETLEKALNDKLSPCRPTKSSARRKDFSPPPTAL